MSASPIDVVLARADAHGLREVAPGRWRCRGACHGGNNASSVSIREGDTGSVLLKCWAGCDAEAVARGLGLELSDLFPAKPAGGGGTAPARRRGLITPRQALDVIEREVMLAWTAAFNLASGHALTADDLMRLDAAVQRLKDVIREAKS